MGFSQTVLAASHDGAHLGWVPSHKHMISEHSLPTSAGDVSSSNGEEFETYSGLGGMDDPYMYPIVKNTFIDFALNRPDHFGQEAQSCPVSKLDASRGSSSLVVDDVFAYKEEDEAKICAFSRHVPLKNTFVHFPDETSHIVSENKTKSCPSSWLEGMGDKYWIGEEEEEMVDIFTSYVSVESDIIFAPVQDPMECGSWTADAQIYLFSSAPALSYNQVAPEMKEPIQESLRSVLSLASALPEPAIEPLEVPTLGSIGHWSGTCRPCAFMARGCTSGASCPFCHLCDPTEKKRRRKEKISFLRELRHWRENGSAPITEETC